MSSALPLRLVPSSFPRKFREAEGRFETAQSFGAKHKLSLNKMEREVQVKVGVVNRYTGGAMLV